MKKANKIITSLVACTLFSTNMLAFNSNVQAANAATAYQVKLTKKSYIYNEKGSRTTEDAAAKGTTQTVYGIVTINGKTYWKLDNNRYIRKVNAKQVTTEDDADSTQIQLIKKSYVYNKKGVRTSEKALAKGTTQIAYGVITIKNKTYWKLDDNRYIREVNAEKAEVTNSVTITNVETTKDTTVYDKDGKETETQLESGKICTALDSAEIGGESYWKIGDNQFILKSDAQKATDTEADKYTPTFKNSVNVDFGSKINAGSLVTNKSKLPDDATYSFVKDVNFDDPTSYTVNVLVTYSDGSSDVTGDITVNIQVDADKYEATTKKTLKTTDGDILKASKAITNKSKLPKGTNFYFEDGGNALSQVEYDKAGTYKYKILVEYPDGICEESAKYVTVKVAKNNADKYKPALLATYSVPKGTELSADTVVTNKNKLPKGTTFDFVDEIPSEVPGTYTSQVEVDYPDGSMEVTNDYVTVTVEK